MFEQIGAWVKKLAENGTYNYVVSSKVVAEIGPAVKSEPGKV